ncbi:DegV family protein [Streptococcus merionis]|uniref:Fatty acid-binding protein, DegV family n=1 Tax=Streptococcus merionis TaxID=400065 RepID=A0A239SXK0_9STRE|nr:DegV family protein [Streptococcus merionis]SNU90056.1 fatty acid-binding protein, DegV family [Streptococcus merionis]
MSFQILTDSTADLPEQWLADNAVQVLGLTVQVDGMHFETVGAERLTSPVLLEKMAAGSQPTTSQINVGQFEEVFRNHAQNGEALLYIAFSSVLSGTYQSAVMARDIVIEEFPEAIIEIVDTLAASAGEGYLVMEAAEVRAAGGSLSEAKARVENLAPRLKTHFLVDDLNHLMRGGRISKASAVIGGVINIKPIISIQSDGSLGTAAKARGKKKAIAEFVRLGLNDLAESTVIVAYADDQEAAKAIKNEILKDPRVKQVLLFPLGPIIAAHVGSGTLALFTIGNKAR